MGVVGVVVSLSRGRVGSTALGAGEGTSAAWRQCPPCRHSERREEALTVGPIVKILNFSFSVFPFLKQQTLTI